MPRVTVQDVRTWFNDSTYDLKIDDFLPETALVEEEIIGTLSARYDTSSWTNTQNTPVLIKTIISMAIASWRYKILYTETTDQVIFARSLDNRVKKIIDNILNGSQVFDGAIRPQIKHFYPNDKTEPLFTLGLEF